MAKHLLQYNETFVIYLLLSKINSILFSIILSNIQVFKLRSEDKEVCGGKKDSFLGMSF